MGWEISWVPSPVVHANGFGGPTRCPADFQQRVRELLVGPRLAG